MSIQLSGALVQVLAGALFVAVLVLIIMRIFGRSMAGQIAALDALTQDQKRLITAELRNVGDAVKRMERGEWLRFAFGSMLAVVLASGLQQSVAASLMRWAVSMFQSVVTGGPAHPLLLTP